MIKDEIFNNSKVFDICKKEGISFLGLFGSYAKDNYDDNSDIDFLAEFKFDQSLFKLIRISDKLSNIFNKKVDLVTKKALSKYIRKQILSEILEIYNENKK